MLRVISLGAGVQSTTMLLMALHGEIEPMPDLAIFADTGWEPKAVYDHLAGLIAHVSPYCHYPRAIEKLQGEMVIPICIVSGGDIKTGYTAQNGLRYVSLPTFTNNADGTVGMARRQCTKEYKLAPIVKFERRLLGLEAGARVKGGAVLIEQWIGISLDEATRMKPSREKWRVNRWPLIEQRMTRHDCLRWLQKHGYPEPPKSACIGCPLHSANTWRRMRDNDPASWQEAVLFDSKIRRVGGFKADNFLHRQAVPLDQVDLSTPQEHGQTEFDDFTIECEGMCGV